MRAAVFDGFGGPEVLRVREVPIPRLTAGEVLVRVEASGVNPKDLLFREKAPAAWDRGGFPRGTGFDFAGEVALFDMDCGALGDHFPRRDDRAGVHEHADGPIHRP